MSLAERVAAVYALTPADLVQPLHGLLHDLGEVVKAVNALELPLMSEQEAEESGWLRVEAALEALGVDQGGKRMSLHEDPDTCPVSDELGNACGQPNAATVTVAFEAPAGVTPGIPKSTQRMCRNHAEGADRTLPSATVQYDS